MIHVDFSRSRHTYAVRKKEENSWELGERPTVRFFLGMHGVTASRDLSSDIYVSALRSVWYSGSLGSTGFSLYTRIDYISVGGVRR